MRIMHKYSDALNRCSCGGAPTVRNAQVAEDCVETWVECASCGKHSDYIEDAYSDPDTAVMCWNAGEHFAPVSEESI